jgi:Na+/proline symporter
VCADARWGRTAHIVFFVFCILTNIIVTAMLLLGGAAVIEALTGMNIYAVCEILRLYNAM